MTSRKEFIKIGVAVVAGAAVAGGGAFSLLSNPLADSQKKISELEKQASNLQQKLTSAAQQLSTANQQVGQLQGQVGGLTSQVGDLSLMTEATVFLTPKQQAIVEAVSETMIPTDETGPGAKEAGVIYFIDRQLNGSYGLSGNIYMKGPFFLPGQKGPITVGGITYSGGSAPARITAGNRYQYSFNIRQFWQTGLAALEKYAKTAYGNDFERLNEETRTKVLQDLWNNVPTDFSGIVPQDFFAEMHDLVWAGFLTDPMYGGNRGMVGWLYTGFSGSNDGNFYGEGLDLRDLMVMDHPQRLKPVSLAQLQHIGK